MDAEEHPSSKDPTIEELQEPHIPEDSLESSISETPVEPHVSKSPLVLPTSKTPSETHTFETLLDAHTSETSLKHSVSDTPPKTPMYEVPVESQISKDPEKHLSSNPSLENYVSASSSEDHARLREDLYSEVFRARKSTLEAPEPEIPKKHSLSGPSAKVHRDTSTGQQKKADEDKEGMVAVDSTAHTTQPGHQLGKKKGKNAASRYRVHPLVPAKQAELAEVAKVNHKDQFGTQVNHLFQWEKHAALSAIQTGLYIGWRCPHYHWDCFRIGDESKCFCGHLLKEHQIVSDISVPCGIGQCRCLMFCFIPSRPEEVGEFWLTRRATFDPKAWRAQCRCKHSHEDHIATGSHPCRRYGCYCSCFESNFLCAACDRRWEEHETFFETEKTRRRGGRPHGADYVPFAEMPGLQEIILRNSDVKASESQGPSGHSSSYPGPPELPGPHSSQPSSTSDPNA